jgi:hypothetical protein
MPFFLASANRRQTELYLPSTEAQNATNANGLFSNTPIDSNDTPPGNNQQVAALSPSSNRPQQNIVKDQALFCFASMILSADQQLGEPGSDRPTPLRSSARRSATLRAAFPPKYLAAAE